MGPLCIRPDNSQNRLFELVPLRRCRGSAIGLLHAEMRRLDSLVMHAADLHKLPAGSALAVDREGFAATITAALEAEPLIEINRSEGANRRPSGIASSSRPDR